MVQAKKFSKKFIIWSALAVLLFAVLAGWAVVKHHTKQHLVTIPSTSAKTSTLSTNPSASSQNTTPVVSPTTTTDKHPSTSSGSNNGPLNLSGAQTFVSNHRPGQNGSSTAEQSVCNTTPGATCSIQFTKDSVVKNLDTKTTDSNGVVVWNWDVKDAGFSAGSWQISAIASLNGQTKTVDDPTLLVIQP